MQHDDGNGKILTKPMSVTSLADWFGIGRNKMAKLLPHIDGAHQVGTRWQVPVSRMPVEYWIQCGLLTPQEFDDAPKRTELHN